MSQDFTSDVNVVPAENASAVRKNVRAMIKYADVGLQQDYDGDLGHFVHCILQHLKVQLERLLKHEGADIDLLAWIARNLLELKLIASYALLSQENLQGTVLKYMVDLRNLDKVWFKEGSDYNEQEALNFKESLENKESFLAEENLDPGKGYLTIPTMAKEVGEEYLDNLSRWLSKYVHPTPVLLFDNGSFMKGDNARKVVLIIAQHCAARLLEEMPGDAERIQSKRAT